VLGEQAEKNLNAADKTATILHTRVCLTSDYFLAIYYYTQKGTQMIKLIKNLFQSKIHNGVLHRAHTTKYEDLCQ